MLFLVLGINNNKQQVLWSNQYAKKEKVKNVSFKYHDFHELYSLPSEKCFDKILFLQSIGHSKNLNHILKECRKVLAEDGTINIYTMFGKSSSSDLLNRPMIADMMLNFLIQL